MESRTLFAYGIVEEFHVDVDGPDARDEEGDSDGRVVEELAVKRPQRVFGFLRLRKLHQTPILRRSTFQRDLQFYI